MSGNIIDFPGARWDGPTPVIGRFPNADESVVLAIDPRDRVIFDADAIEVDDGEQDVCVALPIRVGTHYGEPTIEVGKYSMGLDDARRLAAIVGKFAAGFREATA